MPEAEDFTQHADSSIHRHIPDAVYLVPLHGEQVHFHNLGIFWQWSFL